VGEVKVEITAIIQTVAENIEETKKKGIKEYRECFQAFSVLSFWPKQAIQIGLKIIDK
jgi:hypothetical protein